ncbi:GAF domain-containing protein [Rhodoferax lacus]|nr:GAF domain-containing protein [Rhodoferax lacus]
MHTQDPAPIPERLYAALLACDHVIIRSTGRAALFDAVCQHLVRDGGMQMAWIGMLDASDQRLWPQAQSGEGWSLLDWIRAPNAAGSPAEHDLASAALARNRALWSNDVATEPLLNPVRERAQTQGWHAAAAIPLHVDGKACGVLSLFDCEPGAFGKRVQHLLLQLASNISTAIEAMERGERRAQGELAAQESEERYNALFASSPLPMLVVDPADGRIVDANVRAMDFYGWDHAAITTRYLHDINIQSPQEIREEMARSLASGRTFQDFRQRLAHGEVRNVEVFTSPMDFNGQTYLVSAIHDVTARRILEAQVHQAQSLMQRFIDQLPGTAFVKDSSLRLVMANQQLGALLQTPPQALIGKTAHDIFPPDFADFVTLLDREVLEAGAHRVYPETFNGRHNETSLFVIDDGAGEKFLGGLSLDITDRYLAKERSAALLKIHELAGELPENAFLSAGLELAEKLTQSKIGFLHFVNEDQETLEMVAWTAGALKGCTAAYDAHYPLSQAGIWADCMRQRAPVVFNDYAGYAARKGLPQGHVPMQRLISVPVIEGGQVRMLLGVGNKESDYLDFDTETLQLLGNDLWRIARRGRLETSLKHRVDELVEANRRLSDMQLQLLQSEKMASIGQLASGVAHEINNPIGYVKSNLGSLAGYVDNLLQIVRGYEAVDQLQGDALAHALQAMARSKEDMDYAFMVDDIRKLIDESVQGVQRVSQIVLDLKNFSRKGDVEAEYADLQSGIESTVNVVWNQLKYKVNVVREYVRLPPVHCVASQINQVVMNLLTNAEQAIPEHGTITLRTGVEGDTVWFEVQDTGCGIAADKQSRIFEPFYTSKPVGQGTGLGLSISFGIVQRHGGTITVKSAPGAGSTFRVTLPVESPLSPETVA